MAQAEGTSQPGAAPGQPSVFMLVLLGRSSVGNCSLDLQYMKSNFKSVLPTIGCAFFTKVVSVGTASLKFEIWDKAGQEKYHSVCQLYFRGANTALLVYDITKKEGKEFAESKRLLFTDTSAKLNQHVVETFIAVAWELLRREEGEARARQGDTRVVLNQEPPDRPNAVPTRGSHSPRPSPPRGHCHPRGGSS